MISSRSLFSYHKECLMPFHQLALPTAFLTIGKSLSVISTGCLQVVKLILIYIDSS